MKNKKLEYSAVILLGGKGTRMGSLTKKIPKGLLKIGKYTILSHLYTQLKLLNIEDIFLCLGYHKNKIIKYCQKNIVNDSKQILKNIKKKNIKEPNLYFSCLDAESSTSERIYKLRKKLNHKNLIILYGDTLLKLNKKKYKSFLMKNFEFDILLTLSNPKEKFGIAKIKNKRVISFSEKEVDKKKWVNSGWMLLKKNILNHIKNKKQNFENYILNEVKKFKIIAFKNKNFYLPIDNFKDLQYANQQWNKNRKTWY